MSANDGGPAFPESALDPREPGCHSGGMSLRDWFAGQALAGLIACPNTSALPWQFAENAYLHADAMIEARSKQ